MWLTRVYHTAAINSTLLKGKAAKMFEAPNHTTTPNAVFDYWMPRLNGAEFKVLCILCRKIFGWHKSHLRDRISDSQLVKATGLSRQTARDAIEKLVKLGVAKKYVGGSNGKEQTVYELVVSNNSDLSKNQTGSNNLKEENLQREPQREIQKISTCLKIRHTKDIKDLKALKCSKPEKPKASPYLESLKLDAETTNKLKLFPDKAIAYAIASLSIMPQKPQNSTPVLISLCKKWVEREAKPTKNGVPGIKEKLNSLFQKNDILRSFVAIEGNYFKVGLIGQEQFIPVDEPDLYKKVMEVLKCK